MALRHVTAEDITVRAERYGNEADARCTGTVTYRTGVVRSASVTHHCASAVRKLQDYCEYWDLDATDYSEHADA